MTLEDRAKYFLDTWESAVKGIINTEKARGEGVLPS